MIVQKNHQQIPSGYSLFTYCSFHETKNKHSHDRGKNCMKNVCLDLKNNPTKIINYEKNRNDITNKKRRKKP